MNTIGIDPAKSCTGFAALDGRGKLLATLSVKPPKSATLEEAIDYIINERACTFIVENSEPPHAIAIEDPWMASIGGHRAHGAREKTGLAIAYALYATNYDAKMVPVQTWKRYYKLTGKPRKIAAAEAQAQACYLFPGHVFETQDEIDAALLANYYRQIRRTVGLN